MTRRMRVEPRLCDQDRGKDDAFVLLATQPTAIAYIKNEPKNTFFL